MRRRIGITMEPSSDEGRQRPWRTGHRFDHLLSTYSSLLRSHGAVPLLIPVGGDEAEAAQLVQELDGLLLSGGADLDPALWGEAELEAGGHVLPIGADEKARSRWESLLVSQALAVDLPIFGICRGLQQLNVSLGGSLWQDLERQTGRAGHPAEDPFALVHGLEVVADSEFAALMASSAVTSSHHQGLKVLGQGLQVLATAAGEPEVVEAARHLGHRFVMGVQWHPERMADAPLTQAIFQAFMRAVDTGGRP